MALLTVLTLLACALAAGAWARRRTHVAGDFILASRRLEPWLAASAALVNLLPAWMVIALCAAAFSWGVGAIWLAGGLLIGAALNVWVVAPRLRALSLQQNSVTLIRVFSGEMGERLQPWIARCAVLIFVICALLQSAAVLRFSADLLHSQLQWSVTGVVLGVLFVMSAGVFAGGLRAASFYDLLQLVVLLLVLTLLAVPAALVVGGWEDWQVSMAALPAQSSSWLGGHTGFAALAFAAGALGVGLGGTGQPALMSRLMATRELPQLRWMLCLAYAAVVLLALLALLAGWAASILYAGLEQSQQTLPTIATRLLPPGAAAVAVTALALALCAGLAAQLLALANALATDLGQLQAPLSLAWNRFALVLAAVMMALAALYLQVDIVAMSWFSSAALAAAFGPLLLVRLGGKRVRPNAALGAMWAGFALTVIFHWLPASPGDFLLRALPFVVALGIALTGGERRRNPDRANRGQQTVHDRVAI